MYLHTSLVSVETIKYITFSALLSFYNRGQFLAKCCKLLLSSLILMTCSLEDAGMVKG